MTRARHPISVPTSRTRPLAAGAPSANQSFAPQKKLGCRVLQPLGFHYRAACDEHGKKMRCKPECKVQPKAGFYIPGFRSRFLQGAEKSEHENFIKQHSISKLQQVSTLLQATTPAPLIRPEKAAFAHPWRPWAVTSALLARQFRHHRRSAALEAVQAYTPTARKTHFDN